MLFKKLNKKVTTLEDKIERLEYELYCLEIEIKELKGEDFGPGIKIHANPKKWYVKKI